MTSVRRAPAARQVAEIVLTLLVVAGFANTIYRFRQDGWMPLPYVADVNDTFMDWFNTAYWAHHPGTYDVWGSVYPPLSFIFLRLFGIASCYTRDPFYARHCDTFGIGAILGWYALAIVVAYRAFRVADRSTSTVRGVTFALSMPMLFLLERGNLIIPCMTCFIIAHGGVTRAGWVRALAAGLTINFKPYLVLPTLAWAVKREWRLLELAAVATLAVFCLTYALLGDGSPVQLLQNTIYFAQFTSQYVWEQIYYSSSYGAFVEFNSSRFPTRDFVPSTLFEPFVAAIPVVIHASEAMLALCLAGAWLQPAALTTRRISLLVLTGWLVTTSPGGYTMTFVVFLLFLEKWERPGPIAALIAGYLLCIAYDQSVGNFFTVSADSWLSGRPVLASFGISAGMFVRPGLILIVFWGLALDSFALVVRAHAGTRPALALLPRLGAVRREPA